VASPAGAEPVVSLWYRGTPAGTARLDDLVAVRTAGFSAITWPSADRAGIATLGSLAARAGVAVVLQPDVPALELPGRMTLDVSELAAEQLPAILWRAVARGVRTISLDPRQTSGTGLHTARGVLHEWVAVAATAGRQLSANASLFDDMRPAAAPRILSGGSPAFEASLFQTARAWVLIATNTGRETARVTMQLPAGVPYAIWVSLIDPSTVGMVDRPDGPRWAASLAAGHAAVYVIDKTVR
jgi:hypothetical protein